MERNIKGLKARYPFLEYDVAVKSVMGRNLYYLKLGNGPHQYFYNASHHSLEWITSVLLMKFAENYLRAYTLREMMGDYNIREMWNTSTIYIMPMVNPDGISLVLDGLEEDNPYYDKLLMYNSGNLDFSKSWQANIRGVDLNHNYDASWNLSKMAENENGICGPGPTRYSGIYPESEPESRAVCDFTRNHDFRLVLAYHSQGEVIYWNYQDMPSPEAKHFAGMLSEISGYELDETVGMASFSGYKDWFIEKFNRPGFTVEVGCGENPLPINQFNKIYHDNEKLLLTAATF
jgi:g-D-glutamyl-meso-diaminopimelate peptidase